MNEPCVGCPPPSPSPAKRVVKVKVWYPDAVYVDPDWSELPELGFQAGLLYFHDGTFRIIQGDDYFFYYEDSTGVIYGQTSKESDLEKYPDAIVLRGMWLPDDVYAGIVEAAMAETRSVGR